MKFLGFTIARTKTIHGTPVPASRNGWRRILEAFTGAWQQNVEETRADLFCYPTLYACVMRIATDLGRLPFCLKQKNKLNGIWTEVENAAYSPVLRKPNPWQTPQQFRELWVVSKLTQGNAYGLKRRDNRGVVTELYILDPCRVQPMVTDSGAVYYQLQTDALNTLPPNYPTAGLLVQASEIIHDRCITIHHPLVGVPPLCAAYWPALKNLKILKSSAEFFANNAQPGGILTAPAGMSEDDAQLVKDYWNNTVSKDPGKIQVIGADMKFTSFAMKGADSQLVEQMRYSDEQICQPFGIPPFKIGIGSLPANMDVDSINLMYYDGALSTHIEAMENLLDEGLNITGNLGVWMDIEPLLRMDFGKQADVQVKLVGGKIRTPNEARAKFNDGATPGGDTLWGQQQDYPLGMLADRATWDPNMQAPAPVAPAPDQATAEAVRLLTDELWQRKAIDATREAVHA